MKNVECKLKRCHNQVYYSQCIYLITVTVEERKPILSEVVGAVEQRPTASKCITATEKPRWMVSQSLLQMPKMAVHCRRRWSEAAGSVRGRMSLQGGGWRCSCRSLYFESGERNFAKSQRKALSSHSHCGEWLQRTF